MSESIALVHATFTPVTGNGAPITVQFNPASLEYTVTNTLKEEGSGNTRKQFVTQSTGRLSMDLVFDTTHVGQDVRVLTEKLAKFMEPAGGSTAGGKRAPAVVAFEWGTYAFKGMVDSYKETIDFFAPSGVPLRATVNLALARQDKVFESGPSSSFDIALGASLGPVEVAAGSGGGQFATQLGVSVGDARAGRAIAAANGQESMRFSAGGALSVGGAIELGPPVAFASGGAGVGLGISAGLGAGAGTGAGVSTSAGARASGARASAGVSARDGAFAGLRTPAPARAPVDAERLIQRSETVGLGADDTASFSLGGQAHVEGSTSLSADVGASASLRNRIQFREE